MAQLMAANSTFQPQGPALDAKLFWDLNLFKTFFHPKLTQFSIFPG